MKLNSDTKIYIKYSGVRVIASRILHEIFFLIGKLAIRGTKLTLKTRFWIPWVFRATVNIIT